MSCLESQNRLALMTVYRNHDHFDRSNTAIEENLVRKYSKTEKTQDTVYIDYGVTVFRKEVLKMIPKNRFYDLEELFPRLIDMEELLAFEVRERFYEIGSPQGMKEFERYIAGRKN